MNFGIQQFVVSKTDTDFSQIIFIIVIVCFWVLGIIVKAVAKKAKKSENLTEKQNTFLPPSGTVQYQTEQKPSSLAQYLKRLKKTYSNIIAENEAVTEKIAELPELSNSKRTSAVPGIKTGLKSVSKGVTTPLTYEKKGKIEEKQAAQPKIAEPLLKFESTDDLKKGILYYEILGKPLSLREKERLF